jgi:hypothetical protein
MTNKHQRLLAQVERAISPDPVGVACHWRGSQVFGRLVAVTGTRAWVYLPCVQRIVRRSIVAHHVRFAFEGPVVDAVTRRVLPFVDFSGVLTDLAPHGPILSRKGLERILGETYNVAQVWRKNPRRARYF